MITFNNKAFMLMLFNYDILSIILLENIGTLYNEIEQNKIKK